ncbi:putative RNA-directed DNA polymerase [Tanacetum coccineum]
MQAELNSLNKRKVFGPIVTTHRDVKPVGYIWIFVRKRNKKNEVTWYKARLVAQGFSQRPEIDNEETYSPVMDAITFRYLISLAVSKNLEMRLMDVVTAYLYGSIDNDIYMKILEGFKIPDSLSSKPKEMCSIKLQRSLYGLKQSGWMWYNRLSDYLISKGYINNLIYPCVFIKKTMSRFVIIAVYVDDLNIIGTNKEIQEVIILLKKEFKMKDLGKTKYCLGLQIEYMHNGIIIHQSNYTEKLLKRFNVDKAKPLSTSMVVRSLNVDNDPFRPCEDDEEVLGPEQDLVRPPQEGTRMESNTFFDIFEEPLIWVYFILTIQKKDWLVMQMQTLVATSSNHAEVTAIHEASREYVWLRSMTQLILTSCELEKDKNPTLIYEDNSACVSQMKKERSKALEEHKNNMKEYIEFLKSCDFITKQEPVGLTEFAFTVQQHAIMRNLLANDIIESCSIAGPRYVNSINRMLINGMDTIAPMLHVKKEIVYFSSPNIAKEMHVGHLRLIIIRDTLARMLEFYKFEVFKVTIYVGDRGTQFPNGEVNDQATGELEMSYKASKKRFDDDLEFKTRAQEAMGGDVRYLKAWAQICEISRKGFVHVYERLDVHLEEKGESFYNPCIGPTLDILREKGLTESNIGAQVIRIPGKKQPLLVVKSDGGSNYNP